MTKSQDRLTRVLQVAAWTSAALAGTRPRQGPLRQGAAAGRFQHTEWSALLGRFVQDGAVEYSSMVRVRRLVEAYLHRLAELDPDSFIDSDDQLAFYLNAYNAIVVHQVLLRYPLASLRATPAAWLRSYPIGRHNVSLITLHANVLRSFGDPRIHAALSDGTLGGPQLRSQAFSGAGLQQELDAAMRAWLADPARGLRYDEAHNTLLCAPALLRFGGDFWQPYLMPQPWMLARGRIRPRTMIRHVGPWLPAAIASALERRPRVRMLPVDGRLNERAAAPPERSTRAH